MRPEHIRVASPDDGERNVISGEVATHIYQGSHTITRLNVESLGSIEMRLPGADVVGMFPVGSTAWIVMDLSDAVLLADQAN